MQGAGRLNKNKRDSPQHHRERRGILKKNDATFLPSAWAYLPKGTEPVVRLLIKRGIVLGSIRNKSSQPGLTFVFRKQSETNRGPIRITELLKDDKGRVAGSIRQIQFEYKQLHGKFNQLIVAKASAGFPTHAGGTAKRPLPRRIMVAR